MTSIVDVNTLFGPLPSSSADLPVEALRELMGKHHVRAACTFSTLGLLLSPMVGNAATRAACSEATDLLPVATIAPKMYFGDTADVERLKSDGFVMVRFFPDAQEWPIDFAPFRAIVRVLAKIGMPIMVNIEKTGEITHLAQELADYPGPVILAGVSADKLAETLNVLAQADHFHMEISHMLATGSIEALTKAAGAEKILFGTGAPSQPIASALKTLDAAAISDRDRSLILGENAERLLDIRSQEHAHL